MKHINFTGIILSLTVILSACASPTPAASTDTPLPPPTDTASPPTATLEPSPTPDPLLFRDDFESALGEGWSWTNEDNKYWNLTTNPGWLEMSAQPGYIGDGTVKNLLLRPIPTGNFELETKVIFAPKGNFQIAALVIYESGPNFVQFGRAFCGPCPTKDGFYFDMFVDGVFGGENFATAITSGDTVSLRLRREGNKYTSYGSLDGADWQVIGTHQTDMNPGFVGLTAAQANGSQPGPAQFDYFTIIALP